MQTLCLLVTVNLLKNLKEVNMKKVYLATTSALPLVGSKARMRRIEEDGELHNVLTPTVVSPPKQSSTPGVYLVETRNSLYIVQLVM